MWVYDGSVLNELLGAFVDANFSTLPRGLGPLPSDNRFSETSNL